MRGKTSKKFNDFVFSPRSGLVIFLVFVSSWVIVISWYSSISSDDPSGCVVKMTFFEVLTRIIDFVKKNDMMVQALSCNKG